MIEETKRATSDEDLADKLYSPAKMYATSLQPDVNTLRDRTGMSADDAGKYLAQTAKLFVDADVSPPEAGALHSLLVHHMESPADDATRQEWSEESRRQLRERYGKDADSRMFFVHDFMKQQPDLAKRLEETGLGSHPRFVMDLAERAYKLRTREK